MEVDSDAIFFWRWAHVSEVGRLEYAALIKAIRIEVTPET
jgi:hypothetical protein